MLFLPQSFKELHPRSRDQEIPKNRSNTYVMAPRLPPVLKIQFFHVFAPIHQSTVYNLRLYEIESIGGVWIIAYDNGHN